MRIKNKVIIFSSIIYIPLNGLSWKQLEYRNIKPNIISTIKASGDHLKISVSQSASPLIYKFDSPKKLKAIKLSATILDGKLNLANVKQGEKGGDDFIIRLGLVAKGERYLNFFQKLAAPNWILELYKLGNEKIGIDKIYFYNVASTEINWKERPHPQSELIYEKIIGTVENNKVEINSLVDSSKEYLGVWLSSDGDDTGSSFELQIDQIVIEEL